MIEGQKKSKKDDWIKAGLVLVVFIGLLIWLGNWASSSDTPASTDNKGKPSYEASITEHSAIDPATLRVSVKVKNTGKVSGTPTCTVNASNKSHTYKGFDTFSLDKELAPNEEWSFNGELVVTGQGAAYVTEGSASCY